MGYGEYGPIETRGWFIFLKHDVGERTAVATSNIEAGSVGVVCQDHAACTVHDAIVVICGYLVKELVDVREGGFGRSCLMGADFTAEHQ